ncbi:glycosyltransferase family 4 protein [Prochlorococcus marinus]|jgi:glycosyltransferase involved in cell wall biosynthesis|uniref:Glycosyltransferase family 1 protein n=1 Tax=Prochlorococcus marinus (strain MIT 9301) TaxID=167546 RepID=A3PE73_PROM0|nr:glycosyltransferase family 4 protein [Prochlorococcus marinus]ABO18048.1 Hypothetical protein P9301_14251 [Prochlorococcus marinus str. MIT 9301]
MKRKICQLCGVQFTYEKFLKNLCSELVSHNYEVTSIFKWDEIEIMPEQKGVKFKNIFFERKISFFSLIKTTYQLFKYFQKEKFDIIEIHTPSASIPGRIAAKLARIKVVIYKVHGYYFHENMNFFNKMFHIYIEFFLAKLTDYIFTVSKEDEIFSKVFGFKKTEKIFYIGNGVNKNFFYPASKLDITNAKADFGVSDDLFIIGIVCRLVDEKGLLELFKAFDIIARNNKSIGLFVCGNKLKSDYKKGLEKELEILKDKYENRIFTPGHVKDVYRVYRVMDLFCLPSYREGLPYTLLEAMMSGIPVVASNIRGNREIITHNKNGLLCKPKSVYSLKNALEELIENKNKRDEFSKEALNNVLENYDSAKVLDREIKLIDKLSLKFF